MLNVVKAYNASECRPRKSTLRPSHLVKSDRRRRNRLSKMARKISK